MKNKAFFDYCQSLEDKNITDLALNQHLINDKFDKIAVLNQVQGLQIAKNKLPSWYKNKNILYPVKLSLEQCSSEETAKYKASIIKGQLNSFIDLTGGFGVDTAFIAKKIKQSTYVERNEALCQLAEHNFKALNLNTKVICDNTYEFLSKNSESYDLIYLDPARRDEIGKKVISITDCSPNILEIQHQLLSISDDIMVKYSPMLDIHKAINEVDNIYEIHIISLNNECKELVLRIKKNKESAPIKICCINIKSEGSEYFDFSLEEETSTPLKLTPNIKTYIYEPNSSIMKSGAFKSISTKYNVGKLHKNTHLYTSEEFIKDFPGRIFSVNKISSLNKKDLKNNLTTISQANVLTRNFPLKAEELKNKLKLKDGGENYIIGTTNNEEKRILLICERIK